MMDPYRVLGVDRNADDETIKRAYRQLSRKYHPDANINNPNAAQAEERFKEVNQAYDQIMKEKENGGAYGGGYGSSAGYEGFGGFGGFEDIFGFGGFARGTGQARQEDEASMHKRAAANYINSQHYKEAWNVLNGMGQRDAQWYYYSAIAHAGMGNHVAAMDYAQNAVNMEPGNMEYQNFLRQLQSGGTWYTNTGNAYGRNMVDDSSCSRLCMAGLLCNCLCCRI